VRTSATRTSESFPPVSKTPVLPNLDAILAGPVLKPGLPNGPGPRWRFFSASDSTPIIFRLISYFLFPPHMSQRGNVDIRLPDHELCYVA
jgi:hypothetical protein